MTDLIPAVLPFEELRIDDVDQVGGRNASLGEMIAALDPLGIRVPPGFATTAAAYRAFLEHNGLREPIAELLQGLDSEDGNLSEIGSAVRERILEGELHPELATAIRTAYRERGDRAGEEALQVAVRSSAAAEDLPETSFWPRASGVAPGNRRPGVGRALCGSPFGRRGLACGELLGHRAADRRRGDGSGFRSGIPPRARDRDSGQLPTGVVDGPAVEPRPGSRRLVGGGGDPFLKRVPQQARPHEFCSSAAPIPSRYSVASSS